MSKTKSEYVNLFSDEELIDYNNIDIKIIEKNNCSDVSDYMKNRKDPLSARSTKNFHLKRKSLNEETIFTGSRIGLSDKYPEWKNVNYRFLIKKKYIKKGKSDLMELN